MIQRYTHVHRCDGRYDVIRCDTGATVDTRETVMEAVGAAQDRNREEAFYHGELSRPPVSPTGQKRSFVR